MNSPKEQLTPRGHRHIEAFCLMHYECRDCRHHEIIWNSRDGVTPFAMSCPSCGNPSFSHAYFGSDKYAPHHKPHHGQRVWISMTRERALSIAKSRIAAMAAAGYDAKANAEDIAGDFFEGGLAPDLRIEGYIQEAA